MLDGANGFSLIHASVAAQLVVGCCICPRSLRRRGVLDLYRSRGRPLLTEVILDHLALADERDVRDPVAGRPHCPFDNARILCLRKHNAARAGSGDSDDFFERLHDRTLGVPRPYVRNGPVGGNRSRIAWLDAAGIAYAVP
jgi:hypothetical protein